MNRYDLHLPAVLTFKNKAGKLLSINMVTRNVCAGGCYCETASTISLSTEIKMDLIIALDKFKDIDELRSRIAVSGKVVRRDKEGIAISFDKQYQITALQ